MKTQHSFMTVFNHRPQAVAFISGNEKYPQIDGIVLFYDTLDGTIVRTEIFGLPKGEIPCESPVFAYHIHEGSDCTGDANEPFSNAGGHYNPYDCPHPYHSGDMPPLFSADGEAFLIFLTNRFTVSEIIDKTIILHSRPDDFKTQPSGDSGERMACGIIQSTAKKFF